MERWLVVFHGPRVLPRDVNHRQDPGRH
jgi:hypothetical protein